MKTEVQGFPGPVVLVANVRAIIQTFQSSATTGAKAFWTGLILILPVRVMMVQRHSCLEPTQYVGHTG